MIGTKLAHYEITSHLGSGGMGDVYQATDTKLDRSVAIKFLPEAFSHDIERVARFEREARVLASLNHSNIAVIFGLEESSERKFLVMELVGGETLAERIKRGPISVDESLQIAKQICEALEAAHEKGIIHRDLKPANVKITPDGKVKVLDFGLAKAFEAETSKAHLSQSPTLSMAATNAGMILGTAAYMSPEQAKGRPVDRRTDIFAFGCVLYEMLTGRPAFEGEDVADIISRVLQRDPDWAALPATTTSGIRRLLRRCLQKDRNRRLQAAADAWIEIDEAGTEPETQPIATRSRERLAWATAVLALMVALGAVLTRVQPNPPTAGGSAFSLSVLPPTESSFANNLNYAVSPDGRRLVFVASGALWVRELVSPEAMHLADAPGAVHIFWSPDNRRVGFFEDGKLKTIEAEKGARPQVLADAPVPRGGSWNRDGTIIFVPRSQGSIFRIPASGGTAVEVTALDSSRQDNALYWPSFLPDGRHFLYLATSRRPENRGIYVGSLDSHETTRVSGVFERARYASPGFLLFGRDGTLVAQPFDTSVFQVHGEPLPLTRNVRYQKSTGIVFFSVSEAGVLLYRGGGNVDNVQLTWLDRTGTEAGLIGAPGPYANYRLSPDARRLALDREGPEDGTRNIWLMDLSRSTPTRFTFDPDGAGGAVWSPDGSRILFTSQRSGRREIYVKASDGSGSEDLVSSEELFGASWSPDGKFILAEARDPKTGTDLEVMPASGKQKPISFLKTPFSEGQARFSPDGKWIAYVSDESGTPEVYVRPFPLSGSKSQISTKGGHWPRWRRDGKELFYISADKKIMAVSVEVTPTFTAGIPKALFQSLGLPVGTIGLVDPFEVSPDGQRFLLTPQSQADIAEPLTVVINWPSLLQGKIKP
jgi:eukaryotic-like serine/threonine-protein kinase